MKRIGPLGGMSWESSAEYYRLINPVPDELLGSVLALLVNHTGPGEESR